MVVGLLTATREDVDRLYSTLKAAGHPVGQEPYDAFFGSRCAIVIDPDGNQVGKRAPSTTSGNSNLPSSTDSGPHGSRSAESDAGQWALAVCRSHRLI